MDKDIHLLDVREILEEGRDTIIIEATNETIRIRSAHIKEIIKSIRTNVRQITYGAPEEAFQVKVYPEMCVSLLFVHKQLS